MSNIVNKQFVVEYEENATNYKLVVNYGFNKIGEQEPYFSITADLFYKNIYCGKDIWKLTACGCLHDLIGKYAPEIFPLVKWHLTDKNGPMHYKDNGMFWWKRSLHLAMPPLYNGDNCAVGDVALKNFKSTIVFGAVSSDKNFPIDSIDNRKSMLLGDIQKWLENRLAKLIKAFKKDMKKFELNK